MCLLIIKTVYLLPWILFLPATIYDLHDFVPRLWFPIFRKGVFLLNFQVFSKDLKDFSDAWFVGGIDHFSAKEEKRLNASLYQNRFSENNIYWNMKCDILYKYWNRLNENKNSLIDKVNGLRKSLSRDTLIFVFHVVRNKYCRLNISEYSLLKQTVLVQ